MVTVLVTVYETRISQAFQPGGMIYREANSLRRDNDLIAAVKAPARTGHLRASVGSEMLTSGPFTCSYAVYANADYAAYVLGGTTGPIFPKGEFLWMRPQPHSRLAPSWRPGGRWPFLSVRGQAANNFLRESISTTFALKGLIQ